MEAYKKSFKSKLEEQIQKKLKKKRKEEGVYQTFLMDNCANYKLLVSLSRILTSH